MAVDPRQLVRNMEVLAQLPAWYQKNTARDKPIRHSGRDHRIPAQTRTDAGGSTVDDGQCATC